MSYFSQYAVQRTVCKTLETLCSIQCPISPPTPNLILSPVAQVLPSCGGQKPSKNCHQNRSEHRLPGSPSAPHGILQCFIDEGNAKGNFKAFKIFCQLSVKICHIVIILEVFKRARFDNVTIFSFFFCLGHFGEREMVFYMFESQ